MSATDNVLAEAIHAWVRCEITADEDLVDQITRVAMSYRESGATIDETCEWTQFLLRSWLRRPPPAEKSVGHLRLVPGEGAE